jgi:hypothetical protein
LETLKTETQDADEYLTRTVADRSKKSNATSKRLAVTLGGVCGQFGEIDLVTATGVIEIKFVKRWTRNALASFSQTKSMPGVNYLVYTFSVNRKTSYSEFWIIKLLYDDFHVEITQRKVN